MGNMPSAGGKARRTGSTGLVQGRLETSELRRRERVEKGFKKQDSLSQTGIQIIMGRVKDLPILIRVGRTAICQLPGCGRKRIIKLFDKVSQSRNLVGKPRFAREENPAEEIIHPRHALAAGTLKVRGIERSKIGHNAEMLAVIQHDKKQANQWVREPSAQGRGDGKDLIGHETTPATTHAKGLVQVDAEHGISNLKTPNTMEISA